MFSDDLEGGQVRASLCWGIEAIIGQRWRRWHSASVWFSIILIPLPVLLNQWATHIYWVATNGWCGYRIDLNKGLRICLCNVFPSDGDAAGLGTTFGEPWFREKSSRPRSLCSFQLEGALQPFRDPCGRRGDLLLDLSCLLARALRRRVYLNWTPVHYKEIKIICCDSITQSVGNSKTKAHRQLLKGLRGSCQASQKYWRCVKRQASCSVLSQPDR